MELEDLRAGRAAVRTAVAALRQGSLQNLYRTCTAAFRFLISGGRSYYLSNQVEGMQNERVGIKSGAIALLSSALWGGNTTSLKIGLSGFPPLAMAGVRFLLGGLVVCLWAALTGVALRLKRDERGPMLRLGLLFLLQIALLNLGAGRTLASRASVLLNSYPFFTALFAHLLLPGDRLHRLKVAGMALAFGGVALLFAESLTPGSPRHLAGDLILLASGVLLGLRMVYTKRLTQGIHPARLLFWQACLSVPAFLLLSILLERKLPGALRPAVVAAVLYQGVVVAGLCFILQTALLRRHAASAVTAFAFFSPVFGVLAGALILGEPVSFLLVASLLLVGTGITLVNRTDASKPLSGPEGT